MLNVRAVEDICRSNFTLFPLFNDFFPTPYFVRTMHTECGGKRFSEKHNKTERNFHGVDAINADQAFTAVIPKRINVAWSDAKFSLLIVGRTRYTGDEFL